MQTTKSLRSACVLTVFPKSSDDRLKILVGKPGLDGHSNGAEQIAVKARDVGMEVVYDGIRLTPEEIVQSAQDEGVHVIGLSILSGSHGVLVTRRRRAAPRSGHGRYSGRCRRHHPRGRRTQAARRGRAAGIYAEGLRHDAHNGRNCRSGLGVEWSLRTV